jgi:acetolactate synthase-1/2/3 large subunit
VIGTRANFIFGHFLPPRFASNAKLIQVNIDARDIGDNRPVDVGIVGDARSVLRQLVEEAQGRDGKTNTQGWLEKLRQADAKKKIAVKVLQESDQKPINPLRLCKEISDVLPRNAVLAVDGHETLTFARQSIPTYCPGHRLNVGPAGCIGVGVPFGIGAKAARPANTVMVLSGDGGFGMNGMEMDTAIRHNLPVVVVINNNGGWGSGLASPSAIGHELGVIGRDLGFTRYDRVVEALGGWGELVEEPSEIRPALERAIASEKPALVNVITDPLTMATTQDFTDMMPSVTAEEIAVAIGSVNLEDSPNG